MEVVFLQDVPGTAEAGQIKKVSNGYARNYLIPKHYAELVTEDAIKRLHKIKVAGDKVRIQITSEMSELAKLIEGTTVEITGRVTPTGRYYGAITGTRVADELSEVLGRTIERRLLDVMEAIREPGEFDVSLRLANEIQANIKIVATAEE
ncbi:MAG TPA: 50S ribosomal protein L9 [Dehalococcoidia bacterium]|jgi:large subunit ribosomal protein L9|nr:50S ribosomal protein L9 [Dehalococcoidia bacterium]|tara:strand:+ start:779 stop:1228 length:450 start_codon:yes stop_codon:yes gene_type:complete